MSVGVCCISHNHAHLPIWRPAWANRLTDLVICLLQGQPAYLFQPAHIASHHRYNQGYRDITRVAQYSTGNNLLGYLVFPFQVLGALNELKRSYLRTLWLHDRRRVCWIALQHLLLFVLWAVAFSLDAWRALVYVVVPQFVALHFLLASNYLQHAHAAPSSRYNHSRNFVGPINLFWFNVGYHTAHHEDDRLHWTALPAAHAKISGSIDPRLMEPSLVVYVLRTLCLGVVLSRFRSRQMPSPFDPEETAPD
ncbi:fatty acid desaturase family protein [Noviherbaspirillum humi]|uniref:fatty acid desaturase family protein n=1 Tax=Noviherbaspirillum humi TaxID=1688639 RepID=UPI003CCB9573